MKNRSRLLPPTPPAPPAENFVGRGKNLRDSRKREAAVPSCKTSKTALYCEQSKRLTQYIVLYS
jgi:hypothetical protein